MSDLKNIDKIIKDGVHKEYPMDDQLWAQASQQLDVLHPVKSKKKGWIYLSIALIATISTIYGITSFLQNDHHNQLILDTPPTQNNNTLPSISNEPSSLPNETVPNENNITPNSTAAPSTHSTMNAVTAVDQPTITNLPSHAVVRDQPPMNVEPETITPEQDLTSEVIENIVVEEEIIEKEQVVRNHTPFSNLLVDIKNDVLLTQEGEKQLTTNETKIHTNPRMPNWVVEIESGVALNVIKNNTSVLENGLQSGLSSTLYYGINAGIRLGRFTVSSGIGQAQMNSNFTAEIAPQPRLDTISSYYALVTNEYMHFEQVVSLIERRYKTQWVEDSNAVTKKFEGSSTIQYLSIPISVGYTLPLDRLELTAALSSRFMIRPSFTHDAPADFEHLLAQQEQGIRPSLMMPTLDMGVGYRINSMFSVNAHARWSQATQSLLTTDPKALSTLGVKLGLMYRF